MPGSKRISANALVSHQRPPIFIMEFEDLSDYEKECDDDINLLLDDTAKVDNNFPPLEKSASYPPHALPTIQLPPRPLPPIPTTTKKPRINSIRKLNSSKMPGPGVPRPGPAKLTPRAGPAEWLEQAMQCKYLPESVMKQLCEIVKEHLMEGE